MIPYFGHHGQDVHKKTNLSALVTNVFFVSNEGYPFETYEGKSKTRQKSKQKNLGTQVFTPIENHEKPLGTQGPIWSEEVIDDKCQHLVKIHHCGCIV